MHHWPAKLVFTAASTYKKHTVRPFITEMRKKEEKYLLRPVRTVKGSAPADHAWT